MQILTNCAPNQWVQIVQAADTVLEAKTSFLSWKISGLLKENFVKH